MRVRRSRDEGSKDENCDGKEGFRGVGMRFREGEKFKV